MLRSRRAWRVTYGTDRDEWVASAAVLVSGWAAGGDVGRALGKRRVVVAVSAPELCPVESAALTVALAQVLRGELPMPHVAAVCVLALARIVGRHDWTEGANGAT
jgi:hypothetical protein